MIIEIHKVSPAGSRYEGEEPQEILSLGGESGVEPDALQYDLEASLVSHELVVRGRISMSLRLQCVRCAVFFSTTVQNSSFLRVYPLHEGQDEVDMTADLRETILLGLPNHPRCRADCAGLCARCGVDLNQGPCACAPESESGPRNSWDGWIRPRKP